MDANTVFLWTVAAGALLLVARGLTGGAAERELSRMGAGLLVLAAVAHLVVPAASGWVSLGALTLTLFVPALVAGRAARLVYLQRFDEAAALARWVARLRPARSLRLNADVIGALALAARGRLDEAGALLSGWDGDSREALLARLQLLRISNRWEELAGRFREPVQPVDFTRDPGLVVLALRAAGETGDLAGAEALWREHGARLDRTALEHVRDSAWLFLFAYGGREDLVRRLLATRLPPASADFEAFWLGTAALAAGDASARERLVPLLEARDVALRGAARWRLTRGPFAPVVSAPVVESQARALEEELRFGRSRQRAPSWATWAVALSIVAAFAVQLALGAAEDAERQFELGAMFPPAVLEAREWWRVLSYAWLHFGWLHLAMNLGGVLLLGPWVEHALGRGRFLVAWLASAAGTGLAAYAVWRLGLFEPRLLVGASGGLMGLVGATAAVLARGALGERVPVARRRLGMVVGLVLLQTAFDLSMPRVSFLAHASGLATGLVAGLVLLPRRRR